MRRAAWALALLCLLAWPYLSQNAAPAGAQPGSRVVLDAHNCYPYGEWWADRIDRALSTGAPIAIEQDLAWYADSRSGQSRSVLSHDAAATGSEPGMREYFFERIRPTVEKALTDADRKNWPLITLNLDLKTEEPEHLRAIWSLLAEYRGWITSAPRSADIHEIGALDVRPILVLTGESDAQRAIFYDEVPEDGRLLVFGATHTHNQITSAPARTLAPEASDNYHRWWNNPWGVVEPEGQNAATAWSPQKESRLNELVRYAHERGFWIRFYTLDGESAADESSHGWFHTYNFGSLDAARIRWQAAIHAGVDFIAVDQYEGFAKELSGAPVRPSAVVINGSLTHADHKHLLEREFDVAPGVKRLQITLTYSGSDRRTVIDLGLRGPAGFRGWSGGGPQSIVLGTTYASYGYLPGPLEPGRWSVILGVPNIREESTDTYSISIEQDGHEEPAFPVIRHGPAWYSGEFHSHSGHSDGRAQLEGGLQVKIPAHRVFDAAQHAGLDFIALTDHNTTSHWTEVERLQPYYSNLLLLHAREVTTYIGHFNAFGERQFADFRVGMDRSVSVIAGEIADGGAFVSINHPALPGDERCMGCAWESLDAETMRRMNGIEIVNGDTAEGPLAGWPVWAKMLNSGYHLTAIGGSDEHTPDEAQDHAIGVPTTVVYAAELSEPALLKALQEGQAYVRTRGPASPALQFDAIARGVRWKMGDTLPSSITDLTLSVTVSGAPGQQIQWIRNGKVISTALLPAAQSATLQVQTQPGDWYSVILRDDRGPTLFSNAVYVSRKD